MFFQGEVALGGHLAWRYPQDGSGAVHKHVGMPAVDHVDWIRTVVQSHIGLPDLIGINPDEIHAAMLGRVPLKTLIRPGILQPNVAVHNAALIALKKLNKKCKFNLSRNLRRDMIMIWFETHHVEVDKAQTKLQDYMVRVNFAVVVLEEIGDKLGAVSDGSLVGSFLCLVGGCSGGHSMDVFMVGVLVDVVIVAVIVMAVILIMAMVVVVVMAVVGDSGGDSLHVQLDQVIGSACVNAKQKSLLQKFFLKGNAKSSERWKNKNK